tara:strand:- start:260 stop:652 length:393 start_codon:yes stop_codon:yes gene_type:complete
MHKIDIEGKDAVISAAPFLEAFELKARALACFNVKSIQEAQDINAVLLDGLIKAVSNKPFMEQLWQCAARCTYNNTKITQATFEDEAMRGYFLEIMGAVLVQNVKPFFPKSLTQSNDILARIGLENLKQA